MSPTKTMIDHVELQDFKGHRRTVLPLGRLTVLVGDNASGKTSVLDALALFSAMASYPVSALLGDSSPADTLRRGSNGVIGLGAGGRTGDVPWDARVTIEPAQNPGTPNHSHWVARLIAQRGDLRFATEATIAASGGTNGPGWERIGDTLGRANLYLLQPAHIAAAAYSAMPDAAVELDGRNTAVVLAAMKLGEDEAFERVESALRALIPSVERVRIRLATVPTPDGPRNGHKIYFDFRGAPGVPAHGASHGTLIVLALLTILHGANRPNLILLDDFDHALHPRAQIELMRMIKGLLALEQFADLQIVATTHSPYVLDELESRQIHAFALRDDGTVATKPLSAHPEADKVKGTLTAGQLWSLDPEREWVLSE